MGIPLRSKTEKKRVLRNDGKTRETCFRLDSKSCHLRPMSLQSPKLVSLTARWLFSRTAEIFGSHLWKVPRETSFVKGMEVASAAGFLLLIPWSMDPHLSWNDRYDMMITFNHSPYWLSYNDHFSHHTLFTRKPLCVCVCVDIYNMIHICCFADWIHEVRYLGREHIYMQCDTVIWQLSILWMISLPLTLASEA